MDTVNKEWNIKVVFITFYKFSVTASIREAVVLTSSNGVIKAAAGILSVQLLLKN